jgi:transcription antitermination factor NusG
VAVLIAFPVPPSEPKVSRQIHMEPVDTQTPWVAVQVRPQRERLVSCLLANKGYDQFFPTFRAKAKPRRGGINLDRPLFPGYVFCKLRPTNLGAKIVTTPGVIRILGVPGKPSPISDHQIAALQRIVHSKTNYRPCAYTHVGEEVRIVNGPLTGVTGALTHVFSRRRFLLCVDILRRAVSVEVSADDVISVASGRPSDL